MPDQKPLSVTESPTFKAAVDAAVQQRIEELLPSMLEQLSAARDAVGTKAAPEDRDFTKALALEIAKISGQNSGRVYVDPVVLEEREQATERMRQLLIDCRAAGEMPAYRLIGQTQLPQAGMGHVVLDPLYRDANKVQRETEIDWPGAPNLAMQPINEIANRIFAEFRIAVGAEIPIVEEELGPLALNANGAVVRGAAARAIIRNDPARREQPAGDPLLASAAYAATIRRGNDPGKRKVNVLGTLMPPIEVA